MYAQGILGNQAAVHQYLNAKAYFCNSTTTATLFKLEKLYFYAGHFYRPAWQMNTPFPAKHKGIISLKTVEDIIHRMQGSPLLGKAHFKYNPDFPLKDFLYCGHCYKKLTGYWSKGRNAKYPYYGCANKKDPQRFQVRRQKLKAEFQDFLKSFTLPPELGQVFSLILQAFWAQRVEIQSEEIAKEEAIVETLDKKMAKIQHLMIESDNLHLISKLEKERHQYHEEKMAKEKLIKKQAILPSTSLMDLLAKAQKLLTSLENIRDLSQIEIKQMCIKVFFGGRIYYTPQEGFRTP